VAYCFWTTLYTPTPESLTEIAWILGVYHVTGLGKGCSP